MMKISSSLLFLLLLTFSAQSQLVGHLETIASFPSQKVSDRRVDIWTPNNGVGPYKLLIMHDGQMLFQGDSTWNGQEWGVDETLDSLHRSQALENLMVIGIWNIYKDRHKNYFPQEPFEALNQNIQDSLLLLNRPGQEQKLFSARPNSYAYLEFIFEELLPYIKKNHPIVEDEIYMMGSSMGGLISMYAGLEYSRDLQGVACLSTHWPGVFQNESNPIPQQFLNYLKDHEREAKRIKWYFDRGDATLDALYPEHQSRVDSLFKSWSLESEQFSSRVFPGDPHEETAWRRRFGAAVLFLVQPH